MKRVEIYIPRRVKHQIFPVFFLYSEFGAISFFTDPWDEEGEDAAAVTRLKNRCDIH